MKRGALRCEACIGMLPTQCCALHRMLDHRFDLPDVHRVFETFAGRGDCIQPGHPH